jgi:lysophospholipase L1-like esterase
VIAVSATAIAVAATPAYACIVDDTGQCVPPPTTYRVQGTDGTLAVQSMPAVNHLIGQLTEGEAVLVACQINNGGTDPYDGLASHTWDQIAWSGGGTAWVYDHYISTPPQGADGYSPGIPHCAPTTVPGPGTYYVTGSTGSLAIQSQPAVNHVVGWLGGNGTPVYVVCQINNGGTDPYDGLTSRTWDRMPNGNWVYDWFVSTPPQGSDGFSPGIPHCQSSSPPPTDNSKPYVALGDSYSAGLGSYNYSGYPADGCNRSPDTYSVLTAQAGLPSWVGSTTATLLACNGALISALYTGFKGIPVGQLYTGDLGPKTKLVTITIGGNDVDFVTALRTCLAAFPSDTCWQQQISRMTTIINGDLQSRLVAAYQAIQKQAPNAVIIALTYPDIFPHNNYGPQCGLGLGGAGAMSQTDLDHVNATWMLLNQKIVAAAGQAGIWDMDETSAFADHDLCQLPANRDANTVMYQGADMTFAQGTANLPPDNESFHPTYAGYAQLSWDLRSFLTLHFSP